ncbi:TlpA family protein disulfide reductase [Noviherbaspirillum sp. 17J57-3]|uniref:TlpA family protein disulfide reductase n=2 Tax=Noviherbaspirillum galbum TaxID=2709383 RepID=A0A6B3SNY2_9BURK|nr:TlpA family protein disulfide reductase [Noviherbaspirillum galbum]
MSRKCLAAAAFSLMAALMSAASAVSAAPAAFEVTDTAGQLHNLSRHQGKWVVVNLWATWCPPCVAEIPALEALHKSRQDIVVLGVAADGADTRKISQFASQLGATYPIVAADRQTLSQFHARGFPTTIVYDKGGRQALLKEGAITRQELEDLLQGTRQDR